MNILTAKKRWAAAALGLLLSLSFACAGAQSYRLGDEADEIATIQTALTTLKLYTGSITGHYGEKTQAAVQKFQKRYALEADGVAGEDTIKALYEAAGIDAAGSSSSSSSSAGETALLRYGSQNEAVRQLQQDLTKLGYYSGSVSGHFGSKTEAAVINFQRKNGLTADGVVGAKTLALIEKLLGGSSSGSSSSGSSSSGSSSSGSSSASDSSSSVLKYGVKGSEQVKTLQQNLKALGYYKNGSVTGNYGDLTKEAGAQFQRDNGLDADGIAGSKTLAKIEAKLSGSSSGSSSSSSSSSSVLQLGSSSDAVRTLQQNLKTLGYYSGNLTGNFGEKTKAAVISYQKAKGLTADGIAGGKTLAAITADLNKSSSSDNASGSSGGSLAQRAGQVIFSNYANWRRNYANGELCTVYDFETGYSWTLRIMSKDKHMDAEPATAQDTAIMNKAFGGKQTWSPKVVWVTFSDGKTYIGSTHNVPHTPYHITTNNFDGHLCVHFPRPMADAEATGPYAVSHQEAILAGWEATKKLMQ